MSFLQPLIFWGLPLVLLPVIVHLINRIRYQTVAWATAMFLLAASKDATRQARLREWLILACRALAVLALLLFLSRPLIGGWLGSVVGRQPDTIIVLLDRSPSMEAVDPQTRMSKRALALRRLAEATGQARHARLVLMDSATRQPLEVASLAALKDLSVAGPSDAAADIPALLDTALDYLQANQVGRAEIWLCSDLQKSNWQPDAPAWIALRERFKQPGRDYRLRLLALTRPTTDNRAVRVTEVVRQRSGKGSQLQITVQLTGQDAATGNFPLTIVHEGARSQVEINFSGQETTTQCRLELGSRTTAGWGWIELPADANQSDNHAFFVYPEDLTAKSMVVAESEETGHLLRLAAAPAPALLNQEAESQPVGDPLRLDDVALLIWQTALPTGAMEKTVHEFIEKGGVMLAMPVAASQDGDFRVATWRNTDGPLARTQDGRELPVPELVFTKRAALSQTGTVLAAFEDGQPFLTKRALGKGAIYQCASLPESDWSSLGEGSVLVPMVQRLVLEGTRRLGQVLEAEVGDSRFGRAEHIVSTEKKNAVSGKEYSGIYRLGDRLAALNRPAREDAPEGLDEAGVAQALATIPYRIFEDQGSTAAVQAEMWRWFVLAMLLFLTAEALLALPTAAQMRRWDVPGERVAFGKEIPQRGQS